MSDPIIDPKNFEVRNPEAEEKLREFGRELKARLLPGMNFTVVITTEKPHGIFYLSSANRDDMCKALHEFVENHEGHVGEGAPNNCPECGCPAFKWERNDDGKGYKTA